MSASAIVSQPDHPRSTRRAPQPATRDGATDGLGPSYRTSSCCSFVDWLTPRAKLQRLPDKCERSEPSVKKRCQLQRSLDRPASRSFPKDRLPPGIQHSLEAGVVRVELKIPWSRALRQAGSKDEVRRVIVSDCVAAEPTAVKDFKYGIHRSPIVKAVAV